jgi:biotin carboxylase
MNIVFVTPALTLDALHTLRALVAMPGVTTGLVTQVAVEHLPGWMRAGIRGHYRVTDALDAAHLIPAIRAFQSELGHVDRVIGQLEQIQIPLAAARDATGVAGMGEAVARNFRDKNRMKALLRQSGLPVARQALLRSEDDLRRFRHQVGLPMVVKPVEGMGSLATRQLRDEADVAAFLRDLRPSPTRVFQAEEFVRGTERSFESVLIGGEPVWASSMLYVNRPLEILENGWMQWIVLLPREGLDAAGAAFVDTNAASLRALGMPDGFAHMEWFLRPDGRPVVSEVGARPPGAHFMEMIGYAHDVDIWAKWAELAVFDRWSMPERSWAVGCAYLRGTAAPGATRVAAVHGLEEAQAKFGAWVIDRKLPKVGAPKAKSYEGDGWVIVRHPSTEMVKRALLHIVQTVRVTYA